MIIKQYVVGSIGTNCYLVYDEDSREAMLIDPGDYEAVIEHEIDVEGLELKYIVLTHGHYDHTTGVKGFLRANPEAELAANQGDENLIGDLEPGLILREGDILKLGQIEFRVIETPGHTEAGICLYTEETDPFFVNESFSGTVFTGDTLFRLSVGRTDLEGGNMGVLMSSIRNKLYALPEDTLVLPGHMDPTTIGNEINFNPFVR